MNTDCGYPNTEIARCFEKARDLRASHLRALVLRLYRRATHIKYFLRPGVRKHDGAFARPTAENELAYATRSSAPQR